MNFINILYIALQPRFIHKYVSISLCSMSSCYVVHATMLNAVSRPFSDGQFLVVVHESDKKSGLQKSWSSSSLLVTQTTFNTSWTNILRMTLGCISVTVGTLTERTLPLIAVTINMMILMMVSEMRADIHIWDMVKLETGIIVELLSAFSSTFVFDNLGTNNMRIFVSCYFWILELSCLVTARFVIVNHDRSFPKLKKINAATKVRTSEHSYNIDSNHDPAQAVKI